MTSIGGFAYLIQTDDTFGSGDVAYAIVQAAVSNTEAFAKGTYPRADLAISVNVSGSVNVRP